MFDDAVFSLLLILELACKPINMAVLILETLLKRCDFLVVELDYILELPLYLFQLVGHRLVGLSQFVRFFIVKSNLVLKNSNSLLFFS